MIDGNFRCLFGAHQLCGLTGKSIEDHWPMMGLISAWDFWTNGKKKCKVRSIAAFNHIWLVDDTSFQPYTFITFSNQSLWINKANQIDKKIRLFHQLFECSIITESVFCFDFTINLCICSAI